MKLRLFRTSPRSAIMGPSHTHGATRNNIRTLFGAILALPRARFLNDRGRSLAFLEVGGAASQSQPASKPAEELEQRRMKISFFVCGNMI